MNWLGNALGILVGLAIASIVWLPFGLVAAVVFGSFAMAMRS